MLNAPVLFLVCYPDRFPGELYHTRLVIKFISRVPHSNFTRFVNEKSIVVSLSNH